jgi:pyridoxal phosphate phosphatase PHOSPHO2
MSNILVVFDFDYSLINENSDTYTIEKLTPALMETKHELYHSTFKGQWTKLMHHLVNKMMTEEGVTLNAMDSCLKSIPIFGEVIQAIKLAAEKGADLAILSDANTHYIDVILRHHELQHLFSKVVTNFAHFDEIQQSLVIAPYQPVDTPHMCDRCPPNLCKGGVLTHWREKLSEQNPDLRVMYIGDGGGDFCPCMLLKEGDIILCRNKWALHKKLLAVPPPDFVRAEMVPWNTGADILATFEKTFTET